MTGKRKLQTGNFMDGFEDLDHELHHVQYVMPDIGKLATIRIYIDRQTGDLILNCSEGELVIVPRATNKIRLNVRKF